MKRSANTTKHPAGLAALALVTVAGLAPATALAPQRAQASAVRAVTSTSVPGGTKLWAARYRDQTQQNYPNTVVPSPDGSTVFVTGNSGQAHFTTVAYNAATGARRWVTRFYGLGYSQALSSALSPDGSELFVVGYSESAGFAVPGHLVIVAYNAGTGATLWVQHPFNRNSVATSAMVSPDGPRST
jgi:outer membrane protein assembly factor BamB